ncbi:protein of unknown function [Nitrospira japonica]|uniref:Uncharacterized protein n=1 Tax=Nitrospira japonica TaxID=1325564 RepID=A0A1W1I603_9BACT|nr:protein of unknown function [Nitrospira japonica]
MIPFNHFIEHPPYVRGVLRVPAATVLAAARSQLYKPSGAGFYNNSGTDKVKLTCSRPSC